MELSNELKELIKTMDNLRVAVMESEKGGRVDCSKLPDKVKQYREFSNEILIERDKYLVERVPRNDNEKVIHAIIKDIMSERGI